MHLLTDEIRPAVGGGRTHYLRFRKPPLFQMSYDRMFSKKTYSIILPLPSGVLAATAALFSEGKQTYISLLLVVSTPVEYDRMFYEVKHIGTMN